MANRASLCGILTLLFLLSSFTNAQTKSAQKYVMYVGTYTERGSKGIYAFDFANGHLTSLGLKAEVANPSFLTLSANGQNLYAVSEVGNFQGRHSGGVLAYRTDASNGALSPLNQTPSIGEGPCHLSIDRSGKFLLVANYDSGSVASFALQPDGQLGRVASFVQHLGASVDPERQKGPHAHFIETTADNRFAIAADLGLDQLLIYKFNPNDGSLAASLPPFATVRGGEGPRHFVFSHDQKYLYAVTELDSSVSTFTFDAQQGKLEQKQTLSALPKDYKGKSDAAEIQIDTKGKFLYVSTRVADSIAVFKISPTDGTLTMVQTVPSGGKTPRYFAIDPGGKFLLVGNQESDSIVTFRISQKTGKLLKVGEPTPVISPVSFAFLEAR
jgi:6-phosphogluconolactonase